MTSPVSDVEMPVLAEQARTILAGGRRALLTLPCANVRGWAGLIDDGGEPLLIVGADSPPVSCAGSGRRARVDICGHNGERLVLAGVLRLVPDTTENLVERLADLGRSISVTTGDLDDLRILTMSVDDVLICLPEGVARGTIGGRSAGGGRGARSRSGGGGGAVTSASRVARAGRSARGLRRANNNRLDGRWSALGPARRVDLHSYAFAEPDLVAAYAPDLIRHLNDEHAAQMRLLSTHGVALTEPAGAASGMAGGATATGASAEISRDAVIGATVTSLDRRGLDMWRIDIDGAREVRVAFRSPLVEPRCLGRELRLLLDDAENRTD
ncbi:DUF2470 domain-containing protein [Parafrankia colletiae]|uniref:DUF2470 domain-containing protein n=1 Tax=Parafrankia colletiae TaxID=573497 RepID=A0A1S1QXW4_9ACTN|nr:DUF2470 domain-containing protein [Parafrankia colletiae]OHV38369.1 DUF2470 domain-containing protein [Parafrankia colletiae]